MLLERDCESAIEKLPNPRVQESRWPQIPLQGMPTDGNLKPCRLELPEKALRALFQQREITKFQIQECRKLYVRKGR